MQKNNTVILYQSLLDFGKKTSLVPRFRPLVLLIRTVKDEDEYGTLRGRDRERERMKIKGVTTDTFMGWGEGKSIACYEVSRLRPLVLLIRTVKDEDEYGALERERERERERE